LLDWWRMLLLCNLEFRDVLACGIQRLDKDFFNFWNLQES
jgi:hypothetical protein